jgi:hypothetical protein
MPRNAATAVQPHEWLQHALSSADKENNRLASIGHDAFDFKIRDVGDVVCGYGDAPCPIA